MSQTVYDAEQKAGLPGLIFDLGPDQDTVSKANEETSGLPVGVVVVQGTDHKQCLLPTAIADEVLGIVVRSAAREGYGLPAVGGGNLFDEAVEPNCMANILHEGRIWVPTEVVMAQGDVVHVRLAAGVGGTQLGAIRNDTDGGTAVPLTGARVWRPDQGYTDGLCVIELEGPLSF